MDFYDRVKDLVKSTTSYTLRTFVEGLGMNYDTYNGQRRYNNLPRADEAVRIARALHTSVEYLVTGEEAAPCAMDKDKLIKAIAKAVNDAVP